APADAILEEPVRGPALLLKLGGDVKAVMNDGGVARAFAIPGAGKPAGGAKKGTAPACAAANDWIYCMDAEGAVHRQRPEGEADSVIARGRYGCIASSPIGGGHVV